MEFVCHDGGRAAAGYKGDANDCVVRAVSIITGKLYQDVYESINKLAKQERLNTRRHEISSARNGVYKATIYAYLKTLGFKWTPTMFVGQGCKVHLRKEELPSGKLLVNLSKHVTAVIDGVVYDTYDPCRNGTRCVYGYWTLTRRKK